MAPNNKPHDSLFKDGFSDKDLALDFLRNYLPSRIAEHVDLDTLAITLKLVLSCFRAKNFPESLHHAFELLKLLNELDDNETGLKWMEVIFRYMLETMDISKDNLQEMAEKALTPGKEDTIMTLAEQLRQEGRLEGRMEGLEEKLNRLLSQRFGDIRDPHIQKRLRNATPDQIDRWFDRIIEAKTIEEVIKD